MTKPCNSLSGSSEGLQEFGNREKLVFFWHPQKTGGTSMCFFGVRLGLINFEKDDLKLLDWNCKPHETIDIYKTPAQESMRPLPYSFKEYEPAFEYGEKWLNRLQSYLDKLHPTFWKDHLHVLGIRHPLKRLVSSFFFPPHKISLSCESLGLSPKKCMKVIISYKKGLMNQQFFSSNSNEGKLFEKHNRFLDDLLSNYYVNHLSFGTNNLSLALENLHKFYTVVDLSKVESIEVIKKLFVFWFEKNGKPHVTDSFFQKNKDAKMNDFFTMPSQRVSKHPTFDLIFDKKDKQIIINEFLQDDLKFYEEAISLLLNQWRCCSKS